MRLSLVYIRRIRSKIYCANSKRLLQRTTGETALFVAQISFALSQGTPLVHWVVVVRVCGAKWFRQVVVVCVCGARIQVFSLST